MKPWKIQKFFGDLVYDLRSRGLLPVAIGLVAAMLALPVIVKGSGDSGPSGPAPAPSSADLAPEAQAAVLAYNAGVRNYKQRLNDLAAKDPFVQQFSLPATTTSPGEGGGSSDAGSVPSGDSGGGGVTTTTTPSGKVVQRFYRYDAEVEVGEAGTELESKDKIDVFDYLPSRDIPIVVYLGTSLDKRAAFLVNNQVLSVTGSAECVPSAESCQLLVMEQGESAEMVWAIDNKTYELRVTRVKLHVSKKLPKK